MTSLRIKHPILRLEVVAPDGTRRSTPRVFCQRRRRSVLVDDCCECVHRDGETGGVTPSVDCTIPSVSLEPRAGAGEAAEVGVVLRTGIVVVSESAPLGRASSVLREHGRRSVVIVDRNHVVVGTVHDAGFRRRVGLVGVVRDVMSRPIAVHERTPVRVALKLLAASHLREAAVVSDAGVPLGLFRDVDGLRWIAGARRPPILDSRR